MTIGASVLGWMLLGHGWALAEQHVLFQTTFSGGQPAWEAVAGVVDAESRGLRLHQDSRIIFDSGNREAPERNGNVSVELYFPDDDRSLVPLKSAGDHCYCAFKVRLGRVVFELSDKWIQARLMDRDGSLVEEMFMDQRRGSLPRGRAVGLDIRIRDGHASVLVDDILVGTAAIYGHDLARVSLGAFGRAFVVSSIEVTAIWRDPVVVNREEGFVDIAARYKPSHFNNGKGLRNHHFVVWKGGRAGENALFVTYASDARIHDSLVAAGAVPGDNLTMDTWEKRSSSGSKAPERRIEGTPVGIQVRYGDQRWSADEVLRDLHGKPFDFRFGGNKALIPAWRSGCVVCLVSCPGSKVGNRAYTIRDQMNGSADFAAVPSVPFREGDEVTLRFLIRKEDTL